jgi:hypothetical protein
MFMVSILKKISLCFSAGALGGLLNGLSVWLFGALGIAAALGVHIAPELTPPFLYSKITWGGIWGALLLLPPADRSPWLQGLVISIAPTLVQLLVVFPLKMDAGILGLGLGAPTPLLVFFYNALWGMAAAYWFRATGDTPGQ